MFKHFSHQFGFKQWFITDWQPTHVGGQALNMTAPTPNHFNVMLPWQPSLLTPLHSLTIGERLICSLLLLFFRRPSEGTFLPERKIKGSRWCFVFLLQSPCGPLTPEESRWMCDRGRKWKNVKGRTERSRRVWFSAGELNANGERWVIRRN